MRLVGPQAAVGLSLEGADAETFYVAPPAAVNDRAAATDMIELYWQALARDVPFAQYESSETVADAASELRKLGVFAGPKTGKTERLTIFGFDQNGHLYEPHISQFLWMRIPIGSSTMEQRYRSPAPGSDFMVTHEEWLQIQTGVPPWRESRWEKQSRYIVTGRDLAEFVHYDFLYQPFLNAALILMNSGPRSIYNTSYVFSDTNPYKHSRSTVGFVTLGFAQVVDWLARVTTPALKAAWYQKWLVHRYLRPEEFGGLVHQTKIGVESNAVHSDVLDSHAVAEIHKRYGSYLLPQAYPEGCPLHPSYPSGHATVAGACATVMKALFDENLEVPDCVVPAADGQSLQPYKGPALTVRGEIEKLAYNVTLGRSFAGIHWRSDGEAGIRLGEEVAITILEDLVNTIPEDFPGFKFTRFNGEPIQISKMA